MALSIEKRGDGFRARIRRGGVNISKTLPTLAAANAWAIVHAGAIAGDTYLDRGREKTTALRQLLERYIDEVTPEKKGARTERTRLNDWMQRPWAVLPLTSVIPEHITEWRNEQVALGKAPSTIGNHLNTLSHVFKTARSEWGYKIENPVSGIRRPKARRARVAVPDDELEATLVKAASESRRHWLGPFIEIAAWTVMRQGEIRSLKWGDVDFLAKDIHVRDSKNGDERWVIMLPIVETALLNLLGNKDMEECRDEWIFPAITGNRTASLSLDTVTSGFKTLMAEVYEAAATNKKPQKIKFHDLRHWGCTSLADYHVDALDLAKTAGHKTLQVLMTYFNPKRQDRNLQALSRSKSIRVGSKS